MTEAGELVWRHPLHEFQLSGIERLLASEATPILARKRILFADLVDDVAVSALRRLDLPILLEAVGATG